MDIPESVSPIWLLVYEPAAAATAATTAAAAAATATINRIS